MNEELFRERDRIVANAEAYAAAEGLTELGLLQAAVRFALVAGWGVGFGEGLISSPRDIPKNPYIHSLDKDMQ